MRQNPALPTKVRSFVCWFIVILTPILGKLWLALFGIADAKTLAEWCVKIEDHYSKHHGRKTPMDIEWAKDGVTGELFIVQARPETVRSAQKANVLKRTQVTGHDSSIIEGSAIGSDGASGVARVVSSLSFSCWYHDNPIAHQVHHLACK